MANNEQLSIPDPPRASLRQRILTYLQAHPRSTKRAISDALGEDPNRVGTALSSMKTEDGTIRSEPEKTGASAHVWWIVTGDGAAPSVPGLSPAPAQERAAGPVYGPAGGTAVLPSEPIPPARRTVTPGTFAARMAPFAELGETPLETFGRIMGEWQRMKAQIAAGNTEITRLTQLVAESVSLMRPSDEYDAVQDYAARISANLQIGESEPLAVLGFLYGYVQRDRRVKP
jgi:hypothetical protein